MSFLEPGFLLLALPAALFWLGPFAARRRVHAAIRTFAWLLLVAALARPVATVVDERAYRVAVLDRSTSVTTEADRAAVAWLDASLRRDDVEWAVVEIAGEGREALDLGAGVRHVEVGGDAATSLGAALDAAARAIPPCAASGRVTVHTDGLATDDPLGTDWLHATRDLRARGIEVRVERSEGVSGDLRLVGLEQTEPMRAGRESTLVAHLVGGGQTVSLVLEGPDGELARAEDIAATGEKRIPLAFVPDEPGFLDVTLRADVTGGVDPVDGDLAYERTLPVDEPLEVLYLGSRVRGGASALAGLLGEGFTVTEPNADRAGLGDARVVVLDDRPAKEVSAELQSEIAGAVTDGRAGLFAAGGEAAFGPGGYHEEPIEELLPVEFVQKEEKRDPSTTLVVIIDTSGSMGGNRVQLAKEVARLAIRRLLPHDKVGMVEFYGAKRWAVPIQPASNSIEIERALNRLDAGGGTVILPAIEEAFYGLKNVRTRYKHVLILTDGGVEAGAFEPLVRRMADDGMNVSTVLIGPDAHSEFLVNIANWGQGRFYSVPNRFNLPEILLKQPASAKLPAYRPGIASVRARGGPSWWGDVDPTATPPVSGYVETRARRGAETLLETEDEGHPLLASWRYGLGRVTAMTTELTGPGTESWSDWEGYGELLARAIERTAADDAAPFAFSTQRTPGGALVVGETRPMFRGSEDELAPKITIEGRADELELHRVGPDRFERFVPLGSDEGLRVTARSAGTKTRMALDPLSGGTRERQVAPAVATRFEERVRASDPGTVRAPGRMRLREFGPIFALLALLTYLIDIAYRRWPRERAVR